MEQHASGRLAGVAAWRYLDASLLSLVVLMITALNLLWVSLDSGRVYYDFARHLGNSLVYKDSFSISDPLRPFEIDLLYPPLVYWVTDAFYALLGTELWVAVLSNVVWLAILVFATYGIGTRLWSRRVGLLSALFVVTTPIFVSHFQQYMLDAPLSAMTALSLYLLIQSDHFADRRSSALFVVAAGLGTLVKWTLPLFLFLPVAVSAVIAIARAARERSFAGIVNLAGGTLVALAIAAAWYVPSGSGAGALGRSVVEASGSGHAEGRPAVGDLSSALWYFWNLVNNQLYLLPFLLFLAGVAYICLKDDSASRNAPLLLCIVGSYVVFSALDAKDFRYTMPMLPAVAVIATSWLEYVRPRLRALLTVAIAVYGIAAFLVISFGTSLLPNDITIDGRPRSYTSDLFLNMPPESIRVTGLVVFAQRGYVVGSPSDEDWHKEDVFREIAARGETRTFWYEAGPETIWFNTWDTRYYALRYKASWVATPAQAEFLVIRGAVPPGPARGFARIKQYQLPYGGPLSLFERV